MSAIQPPSLPANLELWQQTLGWQPSEEEQKQFQRLYEEILAANRQLNLTRITAPDAFWEKHLWDSLVGVSPWILGNQGQEAKVIDIGTGAGFPGLPVALIFPHWQVTLLDSTQKKIFSLDELLLRLGLSNVNTLLARAEKIAKQASYKNSYDLALIRAVGNPVLCCRYALPFLKQGGKAILYRGQWREEESMELAQVLESEGGVIEEVKGFTTPLTQSVRHCIYLRAE